MEVNRIVAPIEKVRRDMAYLLILSSCMLMIVVIAGATEREDFISLLILHMECQPKTFLRFCQPIANYQFQLIRHTHHVRIVSSFGTNTNLQQFKSSILVLRDVPMLVIIYLAVTSQIMTYNRIYVTHFFQPSILQQYASVAK